MRNYRRVTTYGCPPHLMLRAAKVVKSTGQSIRSVAKAFDISHRSLTRYLKKFTDEELEGPNPLPTTTRVGVRGNRQVFTEQEEQAMVTHIQMVSDIHWEMSPKEIRIFAWEYGKSLRTHGMPQSWTNNQMAGPDWLTGFLKRHPALFMSTPDNIQLGGVKEIKTECESSQDADYIFPGPVNPAPDCIPKTETKEEWESHGGSDDDFGFVDFQLKSEEVFISNVQFPFECADSGDESLSMQQIGQTVASRTSQEGFTSKFNVETHVLPRIVLKPYTCQLCDEKFLVKSHLEKHASMHQDVR